VRFRTCYTRGEVLGSCSPHGQSALMLEHFLLPCGVEGFYMPHEVEVFIYLDVEDFGCLEMEVF
jgi:hypothetical protein